MSTRLLPLRIKQHQRHVRRQPSDIQRRRRRAFQKAVYWWHTYLQEKHRRSWDRPEHYPLTAYQLYMKFAIIRCYNGLRPWLYYPKTP